MIIANGTMQEVLAHGGGFDEYGAPVTEGNETIGEAVPVNISGSRRKDNQTEDGGVAFTSATYDVLCEQTAIEASEVILRDSRGGRMGRFRIQDVQYLDCVDAVKLSVERYAD